VTDSIDIDIQFIRENLGPMTATQISRKLLIPLTKVHAIGKKLGIKYRYCRERIKWTKEMDRFILNNHSKMTSTEMGRQLQIDRRSVFRRALFLGIKLRTFNSPMTWTPQMDAKLVALYPTTNTGTLAQLFNIDKRQVASRANRLKMVKKVK
jgi:hypothetical protein